MSNAGGLVEAVRDGSMTLEAALEEYLDGRYDGDEEEVIRLLAYANMGWGGRGIGPGGDIRTVDEFVRILDLTPFLPLLDDQEKSEHPLGTLVCHDGETARVIGRRAASPFTVPRHDDFELLIEAPGGTVGFVGESEVEPAKGDGADEE